MHSCSIGGIRTESALRLAIVLLLAGCAHAAAPPPSSAPAKPTGGTAPTATAPASGASRAAGDSSVRPSDSRLDPSEEITPDELASIPDPVPGAAAATTPAPSPGASRPAAAPPTSSAVQPGGTSSGGASSAAAPEAPTPGPATPDGAWHVQIFASPELAVADSVAKSASAALGASYAIEYEGTLYKVRLGAFASEADAQALRDRAVRSGYPGAFRVKSDTR
jgi:hypothetical protein